MRGVTATPKPGTAALARAVERAAFARVWAASYGKQPIDAIERLFPEDRATRAIVTKASIDPGTTGGSGWADDATRTSFGAFLASLAPLSAASTLMGLGMSLPKERGTFNFSAPKRSTAPVATPLVAETGSIPAREDQLDSITLSPRTFGSIRCFTRELSRRTDAEAIVRTILREDAAITLDTAYFSATEGDVTAHAGLLFDVDPLTPDGGLPAATAMLSDMAAIASAVRTGGSGSVVFIAGPARAARVPFIEPGVKATILPSLAIAEDVLIGVDPLSLLHGVVGDIEITASQEATIIFGDAEPFVDTTSSLYQQVLVALRMIGEIAFASRREGAVAWIDGIALW